jgi:putative PIN family toxin of toxin-antitoxin system
MKVFFDTNVYVAEALLGGVASELVERTIDIRWRVASSQYVLDEIVRVLVAKLGFSQRLAQLTIDRVRRRTALVTPKRQHHVSADPADSPILSAAVAAGVDLLVTNDAHLLEMNPYQGVRVMSMSDYRQLLINEGHLKP